jgi:hypothetical protein
MSRAKAKLCKIHDLQGRFSDVILTKKDCDMIAKALENTYPYKEISELSHYFRHLGYVKVIKSHLLIPNLNYD